MMASSHAMNCGSISRGMPSSEMTMAFGRMEANSPMNSQEPRSTKPAISESQSSCTAETRPLTAVGVKKG